MKKIWDFYDDLMNEFIMRFQTSTEMNPILTVVGVVMTYLFINSIFVIFGL